MKHVLFISWVCASALAIVGCADGGHGGGGGRDAGVVPRDSGGGGVDSSVPRVDAGGQPADAGRADAGRDAGVVPRDAGRDAGGGRDAGIIVPGTDAGPLGGVFCTTTADCAAMPGTCCFPPGGMGFCLPGSEVPIIGCVPSGG